MNNLQPGNPGRRQRLSLTLHRPFDRTIERQAQQPLAGEQTANLRYFWWDGIFAATSDAFYLAYIPLFALAYGATNQQVGWITAVGNLLGALALFPGARLMEHTGRRKEIVLWSGGGIGRIALLLLAFVPLLSLPPTAAIIAITTLNGVRAFMANFANPPWTAMVADIVPEFMRGRYFSTRNLTMGVATLVFAALAGWLISAGNAWTADPYLGFQLVFILAFAAGMVSTWSFSRIAEPARKVPAAAAVSSAGRRAEIMQSPGFMGFVISAFIWNFSLQIAGPFFNVYLVTNLGADAGMVGLATSASSLAALGGQLLFGRLMDRKGAIWLLLVSGFPIVVLPMLWAFYTNPGQVVVNNLFGGFLWAGYNLANFSLLLQLTPERQRGHAVALYQTAVFVSAVFGPLVGGYLADNVSFKLIFIVSGLGRLVGLLVFIWLSVLPLRAMQKARAAAVSG
jgi:MFS family permease